MQLKLYYGFYGQWMAQISGARPGVGFVLDVVAKIIHYA